MADDQDNQFAEPPTPGAYRRRGPREYFRKAKYPPQPEPPTPPPTPEMVMHGHQKMRYRDIAIALQLEAAGKTQTEIAQVIGVTQSWVSRVLAEFRDTRDVAKHRLRASAERIARAAVEAADREAQTGNGAVSLELLDRLDVAPKKRDAAAHGPQVMVVVGRPDPAALPALPPLEIASSSSSE